MESQILGERTFDIFLIFIKYQEKSKIIYELEILKKNKLLEGDMKLLYNNFKKIFLPLGEIFNHILFKKINKLPYEVRRKIIILRKNFIVQLNKKISKSNIKNFKSYKKNNNLSRNVTKTKTKTKTKKIQKNKSKGGFLFMLEDKKDEPITGKDITNMLDKYDKAFDLLYYTQYGQDSTVTSEEGGQIKADIANPFTGMATILALSRKNINGALFNQMSQIYRGLTSSDQLFMITYYYDLYKLYMGAYNRSEEKKNPKKKTIEKLSQGPPQPPSVFGRVSALFDIKADTTDETKK